MKRASWFGISYVPSRKRINLVGISLPRFLPILHENVFIKSAILAESRIVPLIIN